MGEVYKARDLEVVVLWPSRSFAPNWRPILRSSPLQAGTGPCRQVTHKNVIRIYDLGDAEGMKFITMEYVDMRDLEPSSPIRQVPPHGG